MARVTYFVRRIAKEGKAEEVEETLRLNFSNVREEEGNVVFALDRESGRVLDLRDLGKTLYSSGTLRRSPSQVTRRSWSGIVRAA